MRIRGDIYKTAQNFTHNNYQKLIKGMDLSYMIQDNGIFYSYHKGYIGTWKNLGFSAK